MVFLIETNNQNVFWSRIFQLKMYFLFKRSLTIPIKGRRQWFTTVVNEGLFSKNEKR